ncbi:CPBP family intramembrane glutamic endopeptidase [Anaerocolumna xylanovorans]|uniref:CAAX protease self-immunity n=1 Tax=Anaerocolumna xylanovorans DSM 12503 TaxID=1121345 RepID=A0A1M7YGG2_9FIRM|nr:CPBP family intramembrane glutamic endopeptidase [Anaerocolumna xylanovorans]SHO51618.1 CAAX protease self-immunity [Anaerocolumna xylanovorans DSM 12503]
MQLFINKLLSSVLQIIVFTIVPFIWWLVSAKEKESFFSWVGIKKIKSEKRTTVWRMTFFVTIGFMIISIFILYILKGTETATSDFAGMGIKVLPAALIYAFLNTALPEELLFRGFLLKRLENKFGFTIANILQSMLFGIMHGIMFISLIGILKAVLVIVFTASIAWFMGYVNEKKANGSICPSWIIHSLSNTVSSLISMFSII